MFGLLNSGIELVTAGRATGAEVVGKMLLVALSVERFEDVPAVSLLAV